MIIYMEQTLALMNKTNPEKVKSILTTGKVKNLDNVNYVIV